MNILEWLNGKKTYLTTFIFAVFNLGVGLGWWAVDDNTWTLVNTILGALGFGFMRAGVTKSGGSANSFLVLGLVGYLAFAGHAQAQERYWSFPEPKITLPSILTKVVDDGDGGLTAEVMPAAGFGVAATWLEMGEGGAETDVEILRTSLNGFAGVTVGGHFNVTVALLTEWFDRIFTVGPTYDIGRLNNDRSRWGVAFGAQYEF